MCEGEDDDGEWNEEMKDEQVEMPLVFVDLLLPLF